MRLKYRYKPDPDFLEVLASPEAARKMAEEWGVKEPIGRFLSLSTGFRDAEGREIFEGDVLETANGRRMEVRFGVHPNEEDSEYELGFFVAHAGKTQLRNGFLFWKDRGRVIGNVFEEPGLMKEG